MFCNELHRWIGLPVSVTDNCLPSGIQPYTVFLFEITAPHPKARIENHGPCLILKSKHCFPACRCAKSSRTHT